MAEMSEFNESGARFGIGGGNEVDREMSKRPLSRCIEMMRGQIERSDVLATRVSMREQRSDVSE